MRGRIPPLAVLSALTAAVAAAPVPKDLGDRRQPFDWRGRERRRVVRTLPAGGEALEFVRVPQGTFVMGSPATDTDAQADERPEHAVTFTRPLWVAKYPVTVRQFAAFARATRLAAAGPAGEGFDGDGAIQAAARFGWRDTGSVNPRFCSHRHIGAVVSGGSTSARRGRDKARAIGGCRAGSVASPVAKTFRHEHAMNPTCSARAAFSPPTFKLARKPTAHGDGFGTRPPLTSKSGPTSTVRTGRTDRATERSTTAARSG